MVTNLSSYGRLTAVPPAPSGQASPRLAIGPASARHHDLDHPQRAHLRHLPQRLSRMS